MSRFTPITLAEVQDVLKADKGWKINEALSGNEYTFDFALTTAPHIVVRVYSTLRKTNEACRGCGADAIRVFAVNTMTNKGWISTRKVLRVEGWRNNLKNAVMDIFSQAKDRLAQVRSSR